MTRYKNGFFQFLRATEPETRAMNSSPFLTPSQPYVTRKKVHAWHWFFKKHAIFLVYKMTASQGDHICKTFEQIRKVLQFVIKWHFMSRIPHVNLFN